MIEDPSRTSLVARKSETKLRDRIHITPRSTGKLDELRCAWCHDALARAPEHSCALCGVRLHQICHAQLHRCPTLGCSERSWTRRRHIATPSLGRRALRLARWVFGGLLGGVLGTIIGIGAVALLALIIALLSHVSGGFEILGMLLSGLVGICTPFLFAACIVEGIRRGAGIGR